MALLLIFGFLLNSVRNVYRKKKAAQEILVRMEKEAEELKNREEFLRDSLMKLETKEGIEFEMRKKLNVAEAGESVAIIVDENISSATPTPAVSSWQKIKNFFIWLFE